jgi:hypothetical protein
VAHYLMIQSVDHANRASALIRIPENATQVKVGTEGYEPVEQYLKVTFQDNSKY